MAAHLLVIATVTIGLLLGALSSAGAAWAHATRIGNDPAENAELTAPPSRVSATFNEPMQPQFAAMTVIGPDGGQWADGDPAVDGAVISVAVRAGAPAGAYTVNYRATSADGHVVTGSWTYRVVAAHATSAAPTTGTTAAAPKAAPEPGSDGWPVWPFVVAAVVVVAGGAVWAVRRRP
jgi:methionine-rich copper-binding protein CopC